MTVPTIVQEVESLVRELADDITRPLLDECLCCYMERMLTEFGCDGTHRHAPRYRDATAPRATALLKRLRAMGACCCDCELFLDAYQRRFDVPDDAPCAGIRRGSVRPCVIWTRIRR